MSLVRYYIDASKLPLDERKELFKKVENLTYVHSYDLNNIGCIEVFFESAHKVEDYFKFPKECIVTRL